MNDVFVQKENNILRVGFRVLGRGERRTIPCPQAEATVTDVVLPLPVEHPACPGSSRRREECVRWARRAASGQVSGWLCKTKTPQKRGMLNTASKRIHCPFTRIPTSSELRGANGSAYQLEDG